MFKVTSAESRLQNGCKKKKIEKSNERWTKRSLEAFVPEVCWEKKEGITRMNDRNISYL